MATNSVSAQLMASPEFAPQVQGIDRQRKIAEMLMTQGTQLPQGQMVSGRYVAPSWTQNLASLANIWAGKGMLEEAEQKQIDLAKALRGKQQEAVQNYFEALREAPEQRVAQAGPPTDEMIAQKQYQLPERIIPAKQANPAQAFQIATGEYAPDWLSSMAIKQTEPHVLAKGATLTRINPLTGQTQVVAQGQPDLPNAVEQAIFTLNIKPDANGNFTPQQKQQIGDEIRRARLESRSVQTVHLPPSESEYSKTFGAGLAKQDLSLKEIADSASQTVANIQRQKELLKSANVYTGFGANQKLDLARLGVALGVGGKNAESTIQNTQQLMAGRAGSTLDSIKSSGLGAGTAFSNKDLEFLQAAKLGNITYDKAAIQRQLDIEDRVARMGTEKWNQRQKDMPKSASTPLNVQPITLPTYGDVDANNPLLK